MTSKVFDERRCHDSDSGTTWETLVGQPNRPHDTPTFGAFR
jgi:hypothetical protein